LSQYLSRQLFLRDLVQSRKKCLRGSRRLNLRSWALDNLDQDRPVEKLAAKAGMSSRNFACVFLKNTGTTPARFVERLRVEAARRRLEESHDKLEKVANDCGFASIQTLRRSFLRVIHVPPNDYRHRFMDLRTN
jgi:transcriptional regulator GlxA family with amidase domain